MKIRNIGLILFVLFAGVWYSCITDEFRVKDITVKEEWKTEIVTPLFTGKLQFSDFIHNWKKPVPDLSGPKVVLDYTDGAVTIPVELIFDESAVIDSFPFLIQGSYEFDEVKMAFKVDNSSPYPLNLKLNFYEKNDWGNFGPDILPKPFAGAVIPGTPVSTADTLKLNLDQLASFKEGKNILFSSWYGDNGFPLGDTISAEFPIKVSIVLIGKVKAKQNE